MSTPESKATTRNEPYKNYMFRVQWDGKYVAGFTKVSGLSQGRVIDHRAGEDPGSIHVLPAQAEYAPITLERGVTYDIAFQQWANKVWDYSTTKVGMNSNQPVSLQDFRKDIVIELYNEAGQRVVAYNIYRCWPSEFTAVAELDGLGNAVAIQTMTLQNEGWERDASFTEPRQPSFVLP